MATCLALIISVSVQAQTTIAIDTTLTGDGELYPFQAGDTIYSLKLNGEVILPSDTSLVRVILTGDNGIELLVYETYPLIASNDTIAIENHCDETCYFDAVQPENLRIEIINAQVYLENVVADFQHTANASSLQSQAKLQMDASKIYNMNSNLSANGINWIAGSNSIVETFYKGKKQMFGEKYNLFGFEYYKEGVFEFFWKTSTVDTSSLTSSFDWRNRHGASDPSSPYFDGDDSLSSGWLTRPKNQGLCGSCWAHSVTGMTEAMINLYFNINTEFDLSEANLLSCVD